MWAAVLVLGACGGPAPPPPLPPTVAKLTITASDDANATAAGHGAPTIVRVYELTSGSGFEKAEFFPLLNDGTALLGPDLVKKDEYLLAPGAKREDALTVPDRVQALGVFAAFREFGSKSWRVLVPLPPNKTTPVTIVLGAGGLVVTP